MSEKNIFNKINFQEDKGKSAGEYLLEQKENLEKITGKELTVEIENIDSYLDTEPPKPVALYFFYIVAPRLGNYRKRILTVVEGKEPDSGRFPVDIYSNIDDQRDDNVKKDEFIDKVSEILGRPLVKEVFTRMYNESLKVKKKK
jgi:hypothetical protein